MWLMLLQQLCYRLALFGCFFKDTNFCYVKGFPPPSPRTTGVGMLFNQFICLLGSKWGSVGDVSLPVQCLLFSAVWHSATMATAASPTTKQLLSVPSSVLLDSSPSSMHRIVELGAANPFVIYRVCIASLKTFLPEGYTVKEFFGEVRLLFT